MPEAASKTRTDMGAYTDTARILTIDKVSYPLTPLTMGDVADAEQRVRNTRWENLVQRIRRVPVAEGVVADAIARNDAEPIPPTFVFQDNASRVFLLKRSIERGGGTAEIVDQLPPGRFMDLWNALTYVSGLGGEDPFTDTTDSGST